MPALTETPDDSSHHATPAAPSSAASAGIVRAGIGGEIMSMTGASSSGLAAA